MLRGGWRWEHPFPQTGRVLHASEQDNVATEPKQGRVKGHESNRAR